MIGKAVYFAKNSIVVFIGFMLSPFSWWNDLFVNVPLAYMFAFSVARVTAYFVPVQKEFFITLFVFGYWVTNVAGFVMLRIGAANLAAFEKRSHLKFKWDLIIAFCYSIVISWLIYSDFGKIASFLNVIPSWVIEK